MEMYNADGSRGEMCGNGIRCVAKYVYDYGLTDRTNISVETLGGIKYLDLTVENGKVRLVKVDMGKPVLEPAKITVVAEGDKAVNEPILVDGKEYRMTCVSMGNPHSVIFMDNIEDLDINSIGSYIENNSIFPNKTNVEFVEIINRGEVKQRTWERGSGETLACGTGASAVCVAGFISGRTDNVILNHLLGGDLVLRYENDTVFMKGEARYCFNGTVKI